MRIWTKNLAALLCATMVSGAAAQTSGDWVRRGDNVALIIDASNSMKALTDAPVGLAPTKQSIAALTAKRVLDRLVDLGVTREIAVIAFGNRYEIVGIRKDPAKRQRYCNLDVETILPLARLSAEVAASASSRIAQLEPRGMTPISQSLGLASENLGSSGGSIVLVTDWEDPCGANDVPPCEALRRINNSRKSKNEGRVALQVMLVPRRSGFDTSYVNGLRDCTGAQVVFLSTPDDVEKATTRLFPPAPRLPIAVSQAPPAPPPAQVRIVQLMQRTSAPKDSSPVILQIIDSSDRVMDTITLNSETVEFSTLAGNYKVKARFPDGREIILPLDALEAGSERVIYVTR